MARFLTNSEYSARACPSVALMRRSVVMSACTTTIRFCNANVRTRFRKKLLPLPNRPITMRKAAPPCSMLSKFLRRAMAFHFAVFAANLNQVESSARYKPRL